MRCPFCGHADTSVKDSRTTDDQACIRRRRFCGECGSRFTTFERIQLRDLVVVKKNGVRVPFDRDKLARSITSAVHKRNLDPERIERLISSLVRLVKSLWSIAELINRYRLSGERRFDNHIIRLRDLKRNS